MLRLALLSVLILPAFSLTAMADEGVHLFILSGQSNMGGLDPDISFVPTVEKEFGKDNVIVIKDAVGGQPIRRWYKEWKPANGPKPEKNGDLYDRLIKKVQTAIKGKKIASVSFSWMQGERDARERHGSVYAASLKGICDQLKQDLGRNDLNVVIGRLSDYGVKKGKYGDWNKIREIQVQFAKDNPRTEWVDTDDLNDGKNRKGKDIKDDLHYSVEGYKTFGTRLAEKSIKLIKQHASK